MMKKVAVTYCLLILASTLFGQSRDALLMRGSAELIKERYAEATSTLTSALYLWPDDVDLLLKRAEALCLSGEYNEALDDLGKAGSKSPGSELLMTAKCYAMKGETAAAINYLRQHLSSQFRIPEDDIKKDPAFDVLQRTDEWYDLWLEEWYTPAEDVAGDAMKMISTGRYDETIDLTGRSINAGMNHALIHHARAMGYYGKGEYAMAIADLSNAIRMDEHSAALLEARAEAWLKSGNATAAISDYSSALRLQPDMFSALTGRAEAYAASGDYVMALADVNNYLSFFEDDTAAMLMCADYLTESGRYQDALPYYNRLLDTDKGNAVYFRQRGRANMLARIYQYAMQDLTMSLDLDPADGRAWLYLGQTALATGDIVSANSYFQKALRLGEKEAQKYLLENQQ